MPRRLLKLVAKSLLREAAVQPLTHTFTAEDIVLAMGRFCALNRKPFDDGLLLKQTPPPDSLASLIHDVYVSVFRIKRRIWRSALIDPIVIRWQVPGFAQLRRE